MNFSIDKYHFKTEAIIEGLPDEELKFLKNNMVRMEVKKGNVLFSEGAFSKGIYILRKGKIKIYQTNKEGKESIVYIFKNGEILGYRPLLCDAPHPTSGAALEDCVITFIARKKFFEALDHSPILARRLLVNLSHEFSVLVNKISVFAQQPAKERVALALRILNEKYKNEGKENSPVVINLSRDDIASYAGTTIETLVRMLRHLKDENIIKTKGRQIMILKPTELEKISEFY
jgi:CRP-like cAMP-binding protein